MIRHGLVADTNPRPESPSMTDSMMNFRYLVEKAPDQDPLREMIRFC